MATVNEPRYDEDVVNLGYLKRILGLTDDDSISIIVTKNYGTAPNPPYGLNDTYMYNGKVYICVRARNVGEFEPSDWVLMADNSALGDYATNTNLNNAVGQLTQKIESTATGINIEVAKKLDANKFTHANIVLAINDNTSSATINADKINLTASTILNLLANNSINLTSKNISINSNNFNVDKNGNLNCSNANVSGTITSSNATITGGKLELKDNGSGASSLLKVSNGSYATTIWSDWIEVSDGSVWTTIGPEQVVAGNGNTYSAASTAGIGYYYDGTTYFEATTKRVYVKNFVNGSLEEYKKNITPLEKGLEIINNTDIYKYNYKEEKDSGKKHIGMIIGKDYKCSDEITSEERDGIEPYSAIAVAYKAIQELHEIVKKQQEEIDELKRSK